MRNIVVCLLVTLILSGCSAEADPFILPVNYTGQALVKVYNEEIENDYRVNIICRDGNYSMKIESINEAWNYAYVTGNRFIITNDRFPENSVNIENFKLADILFYDFDFEKFAVREDLQSQVLYYDGIYKHVLNFSKENLLPKTIFIYNNDKLAKSIEYEKLNIEE